MSTRRYTRSSTASRGVEYPQVRTSFVCASVVAGAASSNPVVGRDNTSRYSSRMKLSIDLTPAQAERLRLEAERLGLTPEDLARAAIVDLLAGPGDDFNAAAERVLRKNDEVYRRLA